MEKEYNFLGFMFDARDEPLMDDIDLIGKYAGFNDWIAYSECDKTYRNVPIESCFICYRDHQEEAIKKIIEILKIKKIDYDLFKLCHNEVKGSKGV